MSVTHSKAVAMREVTSPAIHRIAGLDIRVQNAGKGLSTCILVHDGFCDGSDWAYQVAALQTLTRVVTFDLPGHGRSQPTSVADNLVEVTAKITDLYGADGAILVGHGFGTRLVLDAFRVCRAAIKGIVLVNGRFVPSAEASQLASAAVHDSDASLCRLIHTTFEQLAPEDAALREHIISRVKHFDLGLARELLLMTATWSEQTAAQALSDLNVPVLTIQSTTTEAGATQSLQSGMRTAWMDLVQRLTGAELHVVPNAGHFTQLEAPDGVSSLITRFVYRCEGDYAMQRNTW